MKKVSLSIILAAITLAAALIISGCTQTKKENDDVQNQSQDEGLLAYNAALETTLEEYQPKEDLDKEVLATINGLPISASAVRYTSMASYAAYKDSTDVTEEQKNKEVEDYYRQNAALVSLAYENGIELSEEDRTKIEADISGFKMTYGDEYDAIFADSPFTKYFYYLYYSIYSPLYSKLHDFYLENTESDVAKQAAQSTLDYFSENEFVRAKHILIQFPSGEGENGELTEEQKAATLAKANEVLDKVNAMTDVSEFDALIKEYNEDPGMESNPDGYFFTKGEMVAPFEEAAFALEDNKTSSLVETTYGYHILLKLPYDDEFVKSSSTYESAYASNLDQALFEHLMALSESYEIVYGENHDARVEEFINEYDAMVAEAEAEAEAQTEAETTEVTE